MSTFKRLSNKLKTLVGGSEHIEETEEFKVQKAKAKETRKELEAVIKAASSYKGALEECTVQGRALGDSLTRWGEKLEDNDELAHALLNIGKMQECLEQLREILFQSVYTEFVEPLQSFLDLDVTEYERVKKKFEKTRSEYEVLLNDTKEVREKKSDPTKLYALEVKTAAANTKYQCMADEVSDHLVHVNTKKNIQVLEQLKNFMTGQHLFYTKGFELLTQMQPYSRTLDQLVAHQKQEFGLMKKERADEKQKQIEAMMRSRFYPLIKLFAEPNLALIAVTCESQGDPAQSDERMRTVIRVLDAYTLTLPLIKICVTREVDSTTHPQTLFRGNTTTTKLVTTFTKMIGTQFVVNTLQSCVQQLLAKPDRSFEVDPARVEEGESVENNIKKLTLASQYFLSAIVRSVDQCPVPLREILSHLRLAVSQKFPDSQNAAVGAFVFLRLFCPALIAPTNYGLIASEPAPKSRRAFMLITKVLQNLANGVLFGAKEPYMIPMNAFLTSNLQVVSAFLEKIAIVPQNCPPHTPLANVDEVEKAELPTLHKLLVSDIDKIYESLHEKNAKNISDKLPEVLGQLGQPK